MAAAAPFFPADGIGMPGHEGNLQCAYATVHCCQRLFILVQHAVAWLCTKCVEAHPATASGLYRLGHRALAFADCIRKKRRLQVTGEALHYRFLVLVDVNDCGLRGILSGMCCPKKSFGENSYVLSSPRHSVLYNGSLLAERT